MFGKLSWEAVPFHEPIVMVTIAMIALGGLALFAAITYFKKWTYLWTEWLTSVDHKKIGVMYIIVAMVMLLRGFADALRAAGADVDAVAVTRTETLPFSLPGPADWVILTSPIAVEVLASADVELSMLGDQIAAVGPATARAIEELDAHGRAQGRVNIQNAAAQGELARAPAVRLGVDLPHDKRLRQLCEAVLADPTRHTTLEAWAQDTGASLRTVARLFRTELGSTFTQWRQQVILAKAVSLAAGRMPVGQIATELGYSPSAFSAMVRKSVGQPPAQFLGQR